MGCFTIAFNHDSNEAIALDSIYINFDGYHLYGGRARVDDVDMDPALQGFHTSTSVLRNAVVESKLDAPFFNIEAKLTDIKQMVSSVWSAWMRACR
jgi:hypothetical protein